MGRVHGVMITMIRMIVFHDTQRNVSKDCSLWHECCMLSSLSISLHDLVVDKKAQ